MGKVMVGCMGDIYLLGVFFGVVLVLNDFELSEVIWFILMGIFEFDLLRIIFFEKLSSIF